MPTVTQNLIQLKRSTTASATPTLAAGELGVNLTDQKLYIGNSSGGSFQLTAVAAPGGSNTYVQFNESGALGGNAAFTYDKATNTVAIANTLTIGANVSLNTTRLNVGNSIANASANSILVQVANSTGTANLQPTQLVVGTTTANTTALASGANVVLTTSTITVGNSTVNVVANSTSVLMSGAQLGYPSTFAGIQTNGSMDVSQFYGTATTALSSGTGAYLIDGWVGKFNRAATLAITCQQVTPPGSPSFQSMYQNALQIKATTGLGSLGSGDYGFLEHRIEGYRTARLDFGSSNAQSVTIGFWVYATIAGTMTVMLTNSAVNRTIPVNVVINSGTTWEYKTIVIAGDTSGTWLFTNGIGMRVRFCFGAGAGAQGTNNTWSASEVIGTSATTNFFATTNNLACITGVTVLPGTWALTSAMSSMFIRPFDYELQIALRYWEKSYSYGTALGTATATGGSWTYISGLGAGSASINAWYTRKRAVPSMAWYSINTGTGGVAYDASSGLDVTANAGFNGEQYSSIYCTATGGQIWLAAQWTAQAFI